MTLHKSVQASVKAFADDSSTGAFDMVLSNATRDREGESIPPDSWVQPFPDSIPINANHSSDVSDIVASGRPWLDADGNLRVSGTFASTPEAQHIRSLVADGHLRSVSVEFIRRTGVDGAPAYELIGGAFVNVPANPTAVVLSAKAAKAVAFGNAVDLIVKSGGGNAALAQAIHDAAVHLGAGCVYQDGPVDPSGAADGVNKSADDEDDELEDYRYDEDEKALTALALRVKALRR